MEMNKIQELFQEFNVPEYFKRIDEEHPLDWFIGLDQHGRRTLKLRGGFAPKKIKGSSSIEITQFTSKEFNTIQFTLLHSDMSGLFYNFCTDMIESSRSINVEHGYDFSVNRFNLWKKMFVGTTKKLLTEPEIMGLIGELLFLKNHMFKKHTKQVAILGWSGVDNTHKDFSYDDEWYEIKTTYSNSLSVKISSLEQLDSKQYGTLVVYQIEKMSEAYFGIKLNQLVFDIRSLLDNIQDLEMFDSKLESVGYEYNDYYDVYSYALKMQKFYGVNDQFPRLKKSDVSSSIIKVQYEILLIELADFEIRG